MSMQIGAAGDGGNVQDVVKNDVSEAKSKMEHGDLSGAEAKLHEAFNALKEVGKGAEKGEPPGQKLNLEELMKMLREFLDQGKKQSAEGPANQGLQGGHESKGPEASKSGQPSPVEQLVAMMMQVVQQMGGGAEGKPA